MTGAASISVDSSEARDCAPHGEDADCLRHALEADPENVGILVALAEALRRQGRREESRPYYEAAVVRNAGDARLQRDLGILLLDLDRPPEALTALSRSVELEPRDAEAQNNLGFALERCGELEKAAAAFGSCIALDPDHLFAHVNVVLTLERCNDIAGARRHLDLARQRFRDDACLTLPEAMILKREGRLKEAIRLLESGNFDQDPHSVLRATHELGRLYDRIGDTTKAFRQFTVKNDLAKSLAGPLVERKSAYLETLDFYHRLFTAPWIRSWASLDPLGEGKTPAFLFSFARSGTTLLQQMLSCHPAIHVAGESPAVWQLEGWMRQSLGNYPDRLAGLSEREAADLRDFYFASHRTEPDWAEGGLLIDKNPFIAPVAGLLARIFPGAKMIVPLRHPCDVVLSCYMHFLSDHNIVTIHLHDLDDIVTLYGRTMELLRHYESLLPLKVHYLRYEDLVADPEPTMRGLLGFLELPWDDAVLRYHERRVPSAGRRVPSFDLVSQPPYLRACYRWRRYRTHLGPYLARLEPYCRRFGYET